MTKLDDLETAVTALVARADAAMRGARADAAGKSGTAHLVSSAELDLGAKGWGEVEFTVAVAYKIDVTTTLKSIKSIDWNEVDKPPRADIERAVQRYIDKNGKRYFEELMDKLG